MKQFVGCTQIMEHGKSAKHLASIQWFLGCKVPKPVRTTAQDTLSTFIKASQLKTNCVHVHDQNIVAVFKGGNLYTKCWRGLPLSCLH